MDVTDSAGDVRPFLAGVADRARILRGGRVLAGRIVGTFLPGGATRGRPDISNAEVGGELCG